MKLNKYKSIYDLSEKEVVEFRKKYGDLYNPVHVDLNYYKMYYLGKYDHLIHMFQLLAQTYEIEKVLYPGSFIHLSPSYSFSDVIYVDSYAGNDSFFEDDYVNKYLNLHKFYKEDSKYKFINSDYLSLDLEDELFDLLISSNASSISIDCYKYLKKGGLLLVNNGHSDADNAMDNQDYEYMGLYKFGLNKENVNFVLSGRSDKSSTFYLFKKI